MKLRIILAALFLAVYLLCIDGSLRMAVAGENLRVSEGQTPAAESDEFPFVKGTKELQLLAGPIISFTGNPYRRPAINYFSEDVRLGWMLSTPSDKSSNWLRGNTEFLLEVFGGEVYQGPGNGLLGGTLLLRYNFVQPAAKLNPYLQIGVGALDNDIYKNHAQGLIGEGFEFNLQAGAGFQYFLTSRVALSIEAGYRHISNAGLAVHNLGLNSFGGLAGVSLFF